jgi:hypothetical protein
MKSLTGHSYKEELSRVMEYWECPVHHTILAREFELRQIGGRYYAFHRVCGQQLKPTSRR